jgi:predicted phosphoribosyltransferase
MFRFSDHKTAGELLAEALNEFAGRRDVFVLALRAHATEVAAAVAKELKCPFAYQPPPVTPLPPLFGATLLLVGDGFATARELSELLEEARVHRPASVVVAAPVASTDAVALARKSADGWAFLATPTPFHSVGFWYEDSMRLATSALFAGRHSSSIARTAVA